MFDCHQAEITVMQFTDHSLPAHQSVIVLWDFNSVPYCKPSSPTPMEYALPPSLEWHVWQGRRSTYNIIFPKIFIFRRNSACSFLFICIKSVLFFNFFTMLGEMLAESIFLIMNGDRLIIGVSSLNSIIMYSGKLLLSSLYFGSSSEQEMSETSECVLFCCFFFFL